MTIRLHNTLTRSVEPLVPLQADRISIYSCGPTVYDRAHIGNLSAFIMADTLRRALVGAGYTVEHVMNITDIDDKTIRRSQQDYPGLEPMTALKNLTHDYTEAFMADMHAVGNDTAALTFIHAADNATIEGMKQLITALHQQGFAYAATDGVYFSIDAYKKSGKRYGQLVSLSESSTSGERIQNDEYDKESIHDFALWKVQKPGEPAWEFQLDDHDMTGRPGWHIECSAMSRMGLGQPIDIHTGGIDLAFPHHENEIAQSTAGREDSTYAQMFVHNDHILVDGQKMSKSLKNFFTLEDLVTQGVNPLAFRLLILQAHYRNQTNFTLDSAKAASNRLLAWRNVAALRHQIHDTITAHRQTTSARLPSPASRGALIEALSDDLSTPMALRLIDETFSHMEAQPLDRIHRPHLVQLLETIDELFGLQLLLTTPDIDDDTKRLIVARERARETKNWSDADKLRQNLTTRGLVINDTPSGSIWQYTN